MTAKLVPTLKNLKRLRVPFFLGNHCDHTKCRTWTVTTQNLWNDASHQKRKTCTIRVKKVVWPGKRSKVCYFLPVSQLKRCATFVTRSTKTKRFTALGDNHTFDEIPLFSEKMANRYQIDDMQHPSAGTTWMISQKHLTIVHEGNKNIFVTMCDSFRSKKPTPKKPEVRLIHCKFPTLIMEKVFSMHTLSFLKRMKNFQCFWRSCTSKFSR